MKREQLARLQQGRCFLCKAPASLVPDHDARGEVRGLLCVPCRTDLGATARDWPVTRDRLWRDRATAYLAGDTPALALSVGQ